jgi:hypothetical protein
MWRPSGEVWVILVIAFLSMAAADPGPISSPAVRPGPPAADDAAWSLDDIKDVCEAVQFVAITIGVVVAIGCYLAVHRAGLRAPCVEVTVEVADVSLGNGTHLLELAVVVWNRGRSTVLLAPIRLDLARVLDHEEVAGGGAAAGPARLLPLFEGAIMAEQASLEPGTRQRFVCPVAVLPSAQHLLATVRWRRPDQRTPSEFSRLVRLA